jgi:hypothetical protein
MGQQRPGTPEKSRWFKAGAMANSLSRAIHAPGMKKSPPALSSALMGWGSFKAG